MPEKGELSLLPNMMEIARTRPNFQGTDSQRSAARELGTLGPLHTEEGCVGSDGTSHQPAGALPLHSFVTGNGQRGGLCPQGGSGL